MMPGLLTIFDEKDPVLEGKLKSCQGEALEEQECRKKLNWYPIEIEDGQPVILQDKTSKEFNVTGKVVGV